MNKYRAETVLSVLVAIMLFSVMVLTFNHWQSEQNRQLNYHLQRQQAVQILVNQIALKLADVECEKAVVQNQVRYEIQCLEAIRFPLGEIKLNSD